MKNKKINKEVLMLVVETHLQAGNPILALSISQKAGIKISQIALNACADKCVESGSRLSLREAARVYAITKNEEGLIRVSRQLLKSESSGEFEEESRREALQCLLDLVDQSRK